MAYSMEGVPPQKDATVFNSPWAPGWNSNQSIFKFQEHTGAALRGASHGERLLDAGQGTEYFAAQVGSTKPASGEFAVVPLFHLFGSEELTARSTAIGERATSAYVALHPADAERLGLATHDGVELEGQGALPFIVRDSIREGTVGVSVGLAGLNIRNLGSAVRLGKATQWQAPRQWRASNIIASDARR